MQMMKLTQEDIEKIGTGKMHLTDEDRALARIVGQKIKQDLSEEQKKQEKAEEKE